jgi:hypothetical protein
MPGADAHFLEHLRRTAAVATDLGTALGRGRRERNFEIPPEWDELMDCLRAVRKEQLQTLPPAVRERVKALARLAERAERTLRRPEFEGDFHQLFADFYTAGHDLGVALKEVVGSEPEALEWAHDSDSGAGANAEHSGTAGPAERVGSLSDDPIRQLREQAAEEARQRETERSRQELLRAVEREVTNLRFYGERAENGGSTRGLAEQIARLLAAVRAAGWWDRFEALRPNGDPAWTAALDIYRCCGEGDIDGATAKLDNAETIGESWARARLTDALQRKIPDAILSPTENATEAGQGQGQAKGAGTDRDQARAGGAEGAAGKRGRKSRCDPQKDREIADGWQRARDARTPKKDYARDLKLSLKELRRILDRHARRVRRAQK